MKQLRAAYRIPNDWTDQEVRRVVGLRYELELRSDLTTLPAYDRGQLQMGIGVRDYEQLVQLIEDYIS